MQQNTARPGLVERYFLGFLDELFFALGAGDGDLTLALGHTYRLAAAGTIKIPVLPVLDSLQEGQILPIFLVTLVGVPGEAAEDGPEHQAIGNRRQNQIDRPHGDKHRDQADHQACTQDGGIELVRAVTASHKAAQACCELCT